MRFEIIEHSVTADGRTLELARRGDTLVLRIDGQVLMTSACYGSERAMASVAAEALPPGAAPRVLVGGLGMGHTLRCALDVFPPQAEITVAELLPEVVRFNRGILGPLADHPLEDPRVRLFEGDLHDALDLGPWDVVLLDVDNGPEALCAPKNERLYSHAGTRRLARALAVGGQLVLWSAGPSPAYEKTLRKAGLEVTVRRVRERWPLRKGATHVLFIAQRPRSPGRTRGRG
jgi:spermidine synthase